MSRQSQHHVENAAHRARSECAAPVRRIARSSADMLLSIQRTAGNRAARRWLSKQVPGSAGRGVLQRDPIVLPEITIYGFPEGYQSRSGQPFRTDDAAAESALAEISQTSVEQNIEYAGNIYRRSDGRFSFSPAVPGSNIDSDPSASPVPAGAKIVGTYHSHAGGFAPTDELFSPTDQLKATMGRKVSYLMTPLGNQYKYVPEGMLPQHLRAAFPTGRVTRLQ